MAAKKAGLDYGTGISIVVEHIATGRVVSLAGFALTEFSDTLTANWNKQEVYGRMDPIMNYQGTGRQISIGIQWKDADDKTMNTYVGLVTELMAFQYPTYASTTNALAIQSPPLVKVNFANLISKGYQNNSVPLVCAMGGVAYTPQMGFTPEDSPMVRFGGASGDGGIQLTNGEDATITPKTISLKFDLTVLHDHKIGWHYNGDDATYGWMGPREGSFGPGFIASDLAHVDSEPAPKASQGAEDETNEPDGEPEVE